MYGMTIGQVAKLASVGIETVRFYEREGLIDEPPRRESGYRQYPEDVVKRLFFIKSAKELGFSLKEIADLLSLRVHPNTTCAHVRQRAEAKLEDVETKIRELHRIKRALTKLAASCRGKGPTSECPILDALEQKRR